MGISYAVNFHQSNCANLITMRHLCHANQIMFFLSFSFFFLNNGFAVCEMTETDRSGKLHFQSPWKEKCLSSHMDKKKKNHLFHWTKLSFSLLNLLPLTGEVMSLDHVHLHAAVNQKTVITHMLQKHQIPHFAKCKIRCRSTDVRGTWEGSSR